MQHRILFLSWQCGPRIKVAAQTAVDVTRPEEQQKRAGRRERTGKARETGERH